MKDKPQPSCTTVNAAFTLLQILCCISGTTALVSNVGARIHRLIVADTAAPKRGSNQDKNF